MPYCTSCQEWFPSRVSSCEACGGALSAVAPPGVMKPRAAPVEPVEPAGTMPDRDAERLDLRTARAITRRFDAVRARFDGYRAAPWSVLPASPTRVATALDVVAEEAEDSHDWPTTRRMREAFVDLQAFIPDDAAVAAETDPGPPGEEARALVSWAQAEAICVLRGDDLVVGAHNALREIDIVIGDAQRSLEAVDRYKEAQMSGIGGMVIWPASVLIGFVAGVVVAGFALVGVVLLAPVLLAGFALGAWYGWQIGTLSSRLDRMAMRSDRPIVVRVGRALATLVWVVSYFGGPLLVGFAIAALTARVGLP